jgi:hypothetical protein
MSAMKNHRLRFVALGLIMAVAFPLASFLIMVHADHGTAGVHECSLCLFGPHFHVEMHSSPAAIVQIARLLSRISISLDALRSSLFDSNASQRGPPSDLILLS